MMRIITALALCSAASFMPSLAQARPGCRAVVYVDANFAGSRQTILDDQTKVAPAWNDVISSIQVVEGQWEFFKDADFSGAVLRYGPGAYRTLPTDFNDTISSLRCVSPLGEVVPKASVGEVAPARFHMYGGRSYGWYDDGWNGAGFSWSGSPIASVAASAGGVDTMVGIAKAEAGIEVSASRSMGAAPTILVRRATEATGRTSRVGRAARARTAAVAAIMAVPGTVAVVIAAGVVGIMAAAGVIMVAAAGTVVAGVTDAIARLQIQSAPSEFSSHDPSALAKSRRNHPNDLGWLG